MGHLAGVTSNPTLTIVLVALFASFAIAASSSLNDWRRNVAGGRAYSTLIDLQPLQPPPPVVERLADLRAKLTLNDFNENVVNDEIEADDEEFLRHLKAAAQFLDDKLAREQQQHEQFGRIVPAVELIDDDQQDESLAPRYKLLEGHESGASDKLALIDQQQQQPPALISYSNLGNGDIAIGGDQANDNQAETNNKADLLKYLLLLDKAQHDESLDGPTKRQQQPTIVVSPGDTSELELEGEAAQQEDARPIHIRQPVKLTTLLEEDDKPIKQKAAAKEEEGVSYGKLVSEKKELDKGAHSTGETSAPTSMFGRMYSNLSYYLPFLSQINILRQPAAANQTGGSSGSLGGSPTAAKQLEEVSNQKKQTTITKQLDAGELQSAKQEVSAIKQQPDDELDKSNHLRLRLNVSKQHLQEEEGDERKQEAVRVSAANKRLSVALSSNGQDQNHDHELDEMIASEQQQQPPRRVDGFSLMRQSNLVLPLHDPHQQQQDSLLGKYIYAPTQHYYLNTKPTTGAASFEQLSSAYAFQKEPSASMLNFANLINSSQASNSAPKSNDLYFLVMVGAFCVMAMAVVLAAGLFAYRVQQQRKSSQAPEYPTYGVVGPNNMSGGVGGLNGKCGGAANFMGGYFNNNLAHSPVLSSGKTVGHLNKHLPADLYSATAAAAAANLDSGLDKSSSSIVSGASSTTMHNNKKGSSSTISSGVVANESGRGVTSNQSNSISAANQDAARMYHYQHQKQQMIISDRNSAGGRHTSASDLDSDEEQDDEGSYTVYECPGLASAHEMEIKNPLFNDDQSP